MAAQKTIVITATDSGFVSLAQDTLDSLRRLKFNYEFDFGMLDLGMSAEQRQNFAGQGVRVEMVRSDIAYPMREVWEAQKGSIRTLTARPFLRRYFPDYDVYVWIDADIWAQTPDALNALIAEASNSPALCIASEMDRCYGTYFTNMEVWQHFNKWYKVCYGEQVAATMTFKPMLNAGVWAMNKGSPVWDAWAELYTSFLQTVTTGIDAANFMADQLALNMLIYMNGLPCCVMPSSFNWLAFIYAMPKFDEQRGLYVEPYLPHRPISQFHLAGKDKFLPRRIEMLSGKIIEQPLTYRAFVEGRQE